MTDPMPHRRSGLLLTAAVIAAAGAQRPADAAPVPVRIHRSLPLERLTAAAWAPFGVVLSPEGRARLPINTYGTDVDLYREDFEKRPADRVVHL